MNENVKIDPTATPMLFPFEPAQFWQSLRQIIREEIKQVERLQSVPPAYETPGLTYKPLYKIGEVCTIFQVSRPTIYDWIRHGKLRPYKVRSRVYFLWNDIQQLIQLPNGDSGNR